MPARKSEQLDVRRIAFAALHSRGLPRLEVQERLHVSEAVYYRLLREYRHEERKVKHAR